MENFGGKNGVRIENGRNRYTFIENCLFLCLILIFKNGQK